MKQVLRFERKFLLPYEEYCKCRAYIAKVMEADAHTGDTGYKIRSLYFDTISDSDYFDKVDGVETRRKIRLRLYDTSSDAAWLEMKQKQGDNQLKRSLKVKREDAVLLTKGMYDPLLHYKSEFANECYGLMNMRCYKPKAVVDYMREAYTAPENSTRVTFDREIRASESCFDIFSPDLITHPVLDMYWVVMEVKYNLFLIDCVKDLVSRCERNQTSVSKYCMGRMAAYGMV